MYGISGSSETLIHSVTERGLLTSYSVKTFATDTIGVYEKVKIVLGKAYEGSVGGTDVLRIKQIDFFGTIGIPCITVCGKVRCMQGITSLYLFLRSY